ncbi:hypothetical protein [Roseobacter sp.]|uniref:hypothetical protein n=1 Tax=Roseobacter sp. TaxID=1907202 RepID=UPI003296C963
MRAHPLFMALITFATADAAMAGDAPGPIAEIVTYRVKDGITTAEALKAARQTEPFLATTGAVLSRSLSRDDRGIWTDYILWSSLAAAKATEAQAMQRPEFATFFGMIAEGSAQLRYAPVVFQMD